MRVVTLGALLLALVGCEKGNSASFTLKGEFLGKPIDMGFSLNSGGTPVGASSNAIEDRERANQISIIGGTPQRSVVRTTTCPTDPCPDGAELTVFSPPAIIHAGPWTLGEGSVLKLTKDLDALTALSIDGTFALDFAEPVFSPSGRVTMTNEAAIIRGPQMTTNSQALEFEGKVSLEYQCHEQAKYYRHCGQAIAGDGQKNPLNAPYLENTCPADLSAPYEGSPTWSGNTLELGDLSIDCRETQGSLNGGKPPVLCYSKRTAVQAGGCTWTVHFVTDGELQQFAIAGFADAACATKTCNTYR